MPIGSATAGNSYTMQLKNPNGEVNGVKTIQEGWDSDGKHYYKVFERSTDNQAGGVYAGKHMETQGVKIMDDNYNIAPQFLMSHSLDDITALGGQQLAMPAPDSMKNPFFGSQTWSDSNQKGAIPVDWNLPSTDGPTDSTRADHDDNWSAVVNDNGALSRKTVLYDKASDRYEVYQDDGQHVDGFFVTGAEYRQNDALRADILNGNVHTILDKAQTGDGEYTLDGTVADRQANPDFVNQETDDITHAALHDQSQADFTDALVNVNPAPEPQNPDPADDPNRYDDNIFDNQNGDSTTTTNTAKPEDDPNRYDDNIFDNQDGDSTTTTNTAKPEDDPDHYDDNIFDNQDGDSTTTHGTASPNNDTADSGDSPGDAENDPGTQEDQGGWTVPIEEA